MICSETGSKEKLFITFHSEEEIVSFVDVCNKYDDAIDIKIDKLLTDAKSVMGMLLASLNIPHEIIYECFDDKDDFQEFRDEIIGRFTITFD